jgi:hypothetical protein
MGTPKPAGQYLVPLLRGTRSLVTNPSLHREEDIVWVDNDPFAASMRIEGMRQFQRGHGQAAVLRRIGVGKMPQPTFLMFMPEFFEMLPAVHLRRGVVDGTFAVRKYAKSYGLRYIGPRAVLTRIQKA